MARLYNSNAATTLNEDLDATETTISVVDASVFPSLTAPDTFHMSVDDGTNVEIMKVTAVAGNDLTVVRSAEGGLAYTFLTGDAVNMNATADTFARLAERELTYSHLNTGLITGGALSIGTDTAKFDIAAGTGIVVDAYTDPAVPAFTQVVWSAFDEQTTTNLATQEATDIGINSSGAIVQLASVSAADKRDYIILGTLDHIDNAAIDTVENRPILASQTGSTLIDLDDSIGEINLTGNVYSANGANVTIDKTAGTTYGHGINWANSQKIPNTTTDASDTALTFTPIHQDGSGGVTELANTANIDTNFYDDGSGTLAALASNKHTIHRIAYDPVDAHTFIEYGQDIYNSQALAEAALATQSFVHGAVLLETTTARSFLIVKGGTTDLSDTGDAEFFEAAKSRLVGGVAGGGGGGGADVALSNLSMVAINTDLISDTDSTDSLGSTGIRWAALWTDDITAAGVMDFGAATSLEIPNAAAPTVNAAGEIAVDTTITDHTGMITYYDGVEALYVIALPTANLITTDGYVISYNAGNNEFEMVENTGGGGGGATTELDNLGTVAINTDLISDTDSTDSLGSTGVRWANLWVDTITSTNAIIVASGGTGAATFTDGGVLLGSGTGAITAMGVLADGEMIVGDGTTDPVAETGSTLRTSIGVGIGNTVQFTAINIGHASDSTLARVSAGKLSIEGVNIVTTSSTDTLTNKTFDANGTGNSLSNVDVADLANGTDGELITWSASAAPATVAVGTLGHVLTSGGVGVAPTFQAAAGGGDHVITTGSNAPSSTPANIGDHYVDTNNNSHWFAHGTSASSDWRQVVQELQLGGAGLIAKTSDVFLETYAARTISNDDGAVSIANGDGVSGNPTLGLTPQNVTTIGTTDSAADFLVIWDVDAAALKKVTPDNLGIGGGGGATTELDNLGTVAINTDLISDTDSTDSLGSTGIRWLNGWIDIVNVTTSTIYDGSTSGTTTVLSGAIAGTSVLTLPVATDTLVGKATTDTLTNKTLTSPTMTAPALGTPASGVLTNCTGTAASLTAGTVTTNANLTGDVTSSGNATTIAAKAVDVAMLADGTDGELVTWGTDTVATTVAAGTIGHILTSGGAGGVPSFQATTGWELIGESDANLSGDSSADFTSIDPAYALIKIVVQEIRVSSDGLKLLVRVDTDNGVSFIATGYVGAQIGVEIDTDDTGVAADTTGFQFSSNTAGNEMGTGGGEESSGTMYLYNLSGGRDVRSTSTLYGNNEANNPQLTIGGGSLVTGGTCDALQLVLDSGTFETGTISVYGLRGVIG